MGMHRKTHATGAPASLMMPAVLRMDICEVSSHSAGTLGWKGAAASSKMMHDMPV